MAGHRILVIEDQEAARELACEVVRLHGDEPIPAATVEEALPLIATVDPCGYVMDQQLPLNDKSVGAFTAGGERCIEAERAIDARHNGKCHVTPILALTGASHATAFVAGLFKQGVDAFVPKPLSDNLDLFRTEYREMLARAGREDHGKCAGLSARTLSTEPAAKQPADTDEDVGAVRVGAIARQIGAKTFAEMAFRLVDGHTTRISCQRRRVHATYIDLGFAGKTRQPLREWEIFQGVCANHGVLRAKVCGSANNARQRLFVLSRNLKAAMGLSDEPFRRARELGGWRANFFASSDFERAER